MLEFLQTLQDKSPSGPTPEEYSKQLQAYAVELLKSQSPRGKGVRYTWANGLNDAMGNILGAWMLNKARGQQMGRNLAQDFPSGSGSPSSMLGTTPPAAGGAAPGPLAAAPPSADIWDKSNTITYQPAPYNY